MALIDLRNPTLKKDLIPKGNKGATCTPKSLLVFSGFAENTVISLPDKLFNIAVSIASSPMFVAP